MTGTGAGMKLFCAGVGERFPDVENASRRMKASEAKLCAAERRHRRSPRSRSASTAISFATAKNSPLQNLTQRDIYLALAKTPFGKPNRAKTWHDVNAQPARHSDPRLRPAADIGHARRARRADPDAACEANPAMAALKKSDENKFKAVCTGVREDGGYIEAGENDNLIVQKIEANAGTIGIFGYSYLEENADRLKGIADQRRRADLCDDQQLQISGCPSALHLHQERPRRRDSGGARLCGRVHQGKRVRPERLSASRRPDLGAEQYPRAQPAGRARRWRRSTWRASNSSVEYTLVSY